MKTLRPIPVALAVLLLLAPALTLPGKAHTGAVHKLFITSGKENSDHSVVTLPLFRGASQGGTVWYVVTDSSDRKDAEARGVNYAPKLANAMGTAAVQKVRIIRGVVDFLATVDFSPTRRVEPGPQGFPPNVAIPGAIGRAGYSPYVMLPNGTVLNAPQVANATGRADKVVALDRVRHRVRYAETPGLWANRNVRYISFDASNPVAAALEDVTFAPNMNAAPGLGSQDVDTSSRATIVALVNGQTGQQNSQRQGLNSAILDGLSPLNVIDPIPGGGNGQYSPLWDVHLAAWTRAATRERLNTRQADFGAIEGLVDKGLITGPDGARFGASGFIVNCPVVSLL